MKGYKYVDIHSHVLPGVDDGAPDMEEALKMLQCAANEGIGKIIVTPHQKPDRRCVSVTGLNKRMNALQEEAQRCGLNIRLYPGGELFFRQSLPEELQSGRLCTLAESRYVLVEFFPQEQYRYIRDGLYSLLAAGYIPVVAHVERYVQVMGSREYQEELLDMGCYFQVNAASLTGKYGFGMKRSAWQLVKRRQVHFVGTDAHRSEGNRAPQLLHCAQLLEKKCGGEYAAQLLYRNAEMILQDRELND